LIFFIPPVGNFTPPPPSFYFCFDVLTNPPRPFLLSKFSVFSAPSLSARTVHSPFSFSVTTRFKTHVVSCLPLMGYLSGALALSLKVYCFSRLLSSPLFSQRRFFSLIGFFLPSGSHIPRFLFLVFFFDASDLVLTPLPTLPSDPPLSLPHPISLNLLFLSPDFSIFFYCGNCDQEQNSLFAFPPLPFSLFGLVARSFLAIFALFSIFF